jgi:hypothetical protein
MITNYETSQEIAETLVATYKQRVHKRVNGDEALIQASTEAFLTSVLGLIINTDEDVKRYVEATINSLKKA